MIRLIQGYPDLMNLYGDRANLQVLKKRLEAMGESVVIESFDNTGNELSDSSDLIYIGSGTENKLLSALDDIKNKKSALMSMLDKGCRLMVTGSAMALLCGHITDSRTQKEYEGLGLINSDAEIIGKRLYSEIAADCPLSKRKITGIINTSVLYTSKGERTPFCSIIADAENRLTGKKEGFLSENILATELAGPILFRNPDLLDTIAQLLTGKSTGKPEDSWYRDMEKAYEHAIKTFGEL